MISFLNTKTRLIVAFLSVFIIGGAMGFIGGQIYQRMLFTRIQRQRESERNQNPPGNPGIMQNRMLDNLQKELQLTAEQRQKIEVILQQRREAFHSDMQQIREKMRQTREDTDNQIENILTPEQKNKFQEKRREREKRQRMGGPGGQRRDDNPEPPPPPDMNNGPRDQMMNLPGQRPGDNLDNPGPSREMNMNSGDRPWRQRRMMADDTSNPGNNTNKQNRNYPKRRMNNEKN